MSTVAQAYVQIVPSADGITGNIEKAMGGEVEKAGKAAGKNFTSSFSKSLDKASGKMESAGKKLSLGVSAPITAIGTASIAAWREVDEAMDTIVTKTGASGDALKDMQDRAKNIASDIPVSFQEAGDAVGEVNTRFGLTGKALEDLSGQFVKFSSLNQTDVSSSIDAVQSAMAAFNLKTSDTKGMLDTLNKAGQDTGTNVVMLAQALSANAGVLTSMGYSASDSAMLLANLSKCGVDATSAMAGLKKAYAQSIKTGVPMSDLLSNLTARLQDNQTEAEATKEAYKLFGARMASSLIPALKEGRLSFDALGTSLSDFSGNVSSTYDETLDPLDQMTVNMNKLKKTGAELVDAAAPMLIQALGALGTTISGLSAAWNALSEGQQKAIVKIAGVAAVAGPALLIGSKAVSTVGSLVNAGKTLIPTIGGVVAKISTIGSSTSSAVSSVSSLGTAAQAASAPMQSAGAATGALSKNALGLVAAGAGILLAAAGIALLARSAIDLANAGPAAVGVMGLMVGAVAGMALGAAALAPALTAGAVGLVAFGAGVTLVGAGIFLASSGVALLATQMPKIATHGKGASIALLEVGKALALTSAGAGVFTVSMMAAVIPTAGATVAVGAFSLSLTALTGAFTLSSGGAVLLGLSLAMVSTSVDSIALKATEAGASMKQMVTSVDIVGVAVGTLKGKLFEIGDAIKSAFTASSPAVVQSAKGIMSAMAITTTEVTNGMGKLNGEWKTGLDRLNTYTRTSMTQMNTTAKTALLMFTKSFTSANISTALSNGINRLNTNTRMQMGQVLSTIKASLNQIKRAFEETKLDFNHNIETPHFSLEGKFDAQKGKVPTVGVKWYRKAYDQAYMLNGATIFGAMNGNLLGGGEGSGSELVIGTDKLIDVIRNAVGSSNGYTQNLNVYAPQELSPAEIARQTRIANRQMVLALKGM